MTTQDQNSTGAETADNKISSTEASRSHQSRTWIRRWRNRFGPIETFTLALVFLAAIQAASFIQSERAFIFPTHIEFSGPLIAQVQPLTLHLDVSNSGKSPGRIASLVARATHQLAPLPNYDAGPGRIRVAFPPVPPNSKVRQLLDFGPPWGPDTTENVKAGRLEFYVYGRIEYRDSYSLFGARYSDFCYAYVTNNDFSKAVFRNCIEPQYTNY